MLAFTSNYSRTSSNNGCLRAYLMVSLVAGLKARDFSRKSLTSSGMKLNILLNGLFSIFPNDLMQFLALSSVMKLISSGVPRTSKILDLGQKISYSWSETEWGKSLIFLQLVSLFFGGERGQQALPGNRTFRSVKALLFYFSIPKSSARMQPTDHISIALSYFFSRMISSGARYQRVVTWAVNPIFSLVDRAPSFVGLTGSIYDLLTGQVVIMGSSVMTALASPKSQSLTSDKSSVTRIFSGFRSLWRTWLWWQQFNPQRIWNTMALTLWKVNLWIDLYSLVTSYGKKSRTKLSSFLPSTSWMMRSRSLMIFGWSRIRSKISSRSRRNDSCLFSRNLLIFLMATLRLVFLSMP